MVCFSEGNSVPANCWERIQVPKNSHSVSTLYMNCQEGGKDGQPGMFVHSGPGSAKGVQL